MAGVWVSPTSHTCGPAWANPTLAYDDNVATFAKVVETTPFTWSSWLVLIGKEILTEKIRVYVSTGPGGHHARYQIAIFRPYYPPPFQWLTVHDSHIPYSGWNEISFPTNWISKIRFRIYKRFPAGTRAEMSVHEAYFWSKPGSYTAVCKRNIGVVYQPDPEQPISIFRSINKGKSWGFSTVSDGGGPPGAWPSVIYDPTNCHVLYATWGRDGPGAYEELRISKSVNDGVTWGPSTLIINNSPFNPYFYQYSICAPIAIAATGSIFVAWAHQSTVFVARSDDGGVTWPAVNIASLGLHAHHERIDICAANGRVYVSIDDGGNALVWISHNNGATYMGPFVAGGSAHDSVRIEVGFDGTIYVLRCGVGTIYIRYSIDHGATWSDSSELGITPFTNTPDFKACDGGELYAIWQVDTQIIRLAHSIDRGKTWEIITYGDPPKDMIRVHPPDYLDSFFTMDLERDKRFLAVGYATHVGIRCFVLGACTGRRATVRYLHA